MSTKARLREDFRIKKQNKQINDNCIGVQEKIMCSDTTNQNIFLEFNFRPGERIVAMSQRSLQR